MDLPAERAMRGAVPVLPGRTRLRRRPSGEPPALPHHLHTSGVGWLVASVVLVLLTMLVFARGLRGIAVDVTVADQAVVQWLQQADGPAAVGTFRALAWPSSWTMLNIVGPALLLALLAVRRFRHLIIALGAITLLQFLVGIWVAEVARRPRPFGVAFRTDWTGSAMPSLQMALFTAGVVAILYSLVPEGRWRNRGKWIASAVVAVVGLSRVALGVDAPSDVLVGTVLGVTVPLLAFRWFTPNAVFPVSYLRGRTAHLDVGGARGEAIRRALEDQMGLIVDDVQPFGLSGSAGSTPLRISVPGDLPRVLFGKLYAKSHLQADRWYKLGRELLYGQLEDEKPFNTVRRLVQQEDYALFLMHRAGLPSPTPYGFVEITPEREYLLVTEFLDGAVELGEAEVDDQIIDDGLRIIRVLWDGGLAHRDIKPANLLVQDGHLVVIDVAFAEARPSPWRQAVDLANMMLCLALRSDPERVYRRALRMFSVEEITEGFAAARGLALPSQLRRMMRAQGRDLHAEFVRLLPRSPRPIPIQRWTARRLLLLGATAVVLVLAYEVVVGGRADPLPRTGDIFAHSLPCADAQPQWLLAQSVPTTSRVVCVQSLPAGWELGHVTVVNGESVVTFNHDRAGEGALIARLSAGCAPSGADEIASAQPGIRSYQRVTTAADRSTTSRFDVFAGGCLTTRLLAPSDQGVRLTADIPRLLGFTARRSLDQALDQRSGGRLQLDSPE